MTDDRQNKSLKKSEPFWFPVVPASEERIVAKDVDFHNLIRVRTMAKILILVMVVMIYSSLWVMEIGARREILSTMSFIIALRLVMIGVLIAFLIKVAPPASSNEMTEKISFRVLALVTFGLALAGMTTGLAQAASPGLSAYLLAVFVVAAFIYLTLPQSLLVFGLGWVALALTMMACQPDKMRLMPNLVNSALLTALAVIVSRIVYGGRVGEYFSQQALRQRDTDLEKAHRMLETLSYFDVAIGVPNRRHFEDFLQREWRRAMRDGIRITVILGEIDYFQEYLNLYGQEAGNRCLKGVAQVLGRTASRAGDLTARYGTDQLAVVLGNSDLYGVIQIGQTLCRAVADLKLVHAGSKEGRVTVSLGLATLRPEQGQGHKAIVDAAEEALRQARAGGRNQCRWAGQTGGPQHKGRLG